MTTTIDPAVEAVAEKLMRAVNAPESVIYEVARGAVAAARAIDIGGTSTIAVSVTSVDLLALKKLAVICGALADSLPGTARIEQRALTRVLVDHIGQIEQRMQRHG